MNAIEIDDNDDHVGEVVGCFAVTDHRRIVGLVKSQIGIAMEGWILTADPIDPRD